MTHPPAPQPHPDWPRQPGPVPRTDVPAGNVAGLIAVIAAGAMAVVSVAALVAQAFALVEGGGAAFRLVSIAGAVATAVVAIVAIVFGIVGLTRRGRPKALAGIGLGAGAMQLFGVATGSFLYPALVTSLAG